MNNPVVSNEAELLFSFNLSCCFCSCDKQSIHKQQNILVQGYSTGGPRAKSGPWGDFSLAYFIKKFK